MWRTVKLGDVLKTGAGGTPLKSKKITTREVPSSGY